MTPRAEWLEHDYYAILGVADGADAEQITHAYRRLARQWHPDANPGDGRAEARFKEITAAYDVLRDPSRRAEYDQLRAMAAGSSRSTDAGTWPLTDPGPIRIHVKRSLDSSSFSFGRSEWGDVFGSLFATTNTAGGSHHRPLRGEDHEITIDLPFEDAVAGTTVHLAPSERRRDGGVDLEIPAGVEDGTRIRVAGRGAPGRDGAPPGDLRVTLHVLPHPRFGRRGRDLTGELRISVAEAALGTTVKVPTLSGQTVTMKIPSGTQPGQVLRIKGKGVPAREGEPPGDLLITVRVVVPRHLNDRQRRTYEQLARICPAPSRFARATEGRR